MKWEQGKWQFIFSFLPDYRRHDYYTLIFGIFRLKEFPPEGETLWNKHYDGFLLRKDFRYDGFEINI